MFKIVLLVLKYWYNASEKIVDDQLKPQLYENSEFYFNTLSFLHKTIVKPKINYINVKLLNVIIITF